MDGQLVRPGVAGGPRRADRRDARQPADGGRAAGGVRRPRRAVRGQLRRPPGRAQRRRRGLLARDHPLRDVFERIFAWSVASGVLWLAGAALRRRRAAAAVGPGARARPLRAARRLLDAAAAAARRRPTGRSRAATSPSAASCFIIIALGESIVVTGATAAEAGLTATVVALPRRRVPARPRRCGGSTSARRPSARATRCATATTPAASRATPTPTCTCRSWRASSPPPSATTCSIAHPRSGCTASRSAVVVGGPALYLLGENLFRRRITGTRQPQALRRRGRVCVALAAPGPARLRAGA